MFTPFSRNKNRTARRQRSRRPRLDALESRQLMTADVGVEALTTADLNADGQQELYSAAVVAEQVEIRRGITSDQAGDVIWSAPAVDWSVSAMTAGDSDGDGDELYVALKHRNGNAYIYRSETGQDLGSAIWQQTGQAGGNMSVRALATGDTDANGHDELFIGLHADDGSAYIYRSDSGLNVGSRIWQSSGSKAGRWAIQALAVGDADDNGSDELYTGLRLYDGSAFIFRSDSGLSVGSSIWQSSGTKAGRWTVEALAVGDSDDDGNTKLLVGLEFHTGEAFLYQSDAGLNVGTNIWRAGSSDATLRSVTVGDVDGDGDNELYLGVDHSESDSMVLEAEQASDLEAIDRVLAAWGEDDGLFRSYSLRDHVNINYDGIILNHNETFLEDLS